MWWGERSQEAQAQKRIARHHKKIDGIDLFKEAFNRGFAAGFVVGFIICLLIAFIGCYVP